MQTRVRADPALGRDREVRFLLGHAAATQHCDAVDDDRVPQEIRKFTSGTCAVDCAVIVYDQRAMAVINFQDAVGTTAHVVVVTSWHRQKAVLGRRVVDPSWDSASACRPGHQVRRWSPRPHFGRRPPGYGLRWIPGCLFRTSPEVVKQAAMVKGTVGDAVSVPRYRRLEVDSSLTPSSSDTRSAARQTVAGWLWTAAGPIFLVAQLVAGRAWRTPYSWSRNNISDLGNVGCGPWGDDRRYVCSPLHDVMNFGLVITGILVAAGVILLWQSPHRPNRLGGILILLAEWAM